MQAFATGLGNPTEVVAGADGALYLPDLTAGTVKRIAVTGTNRPPVAKMAATPAQGPPPLVVQLTSAGSGDPDGDPLTLTWSFGDGTPGASGATVAHTYAAAGVYTARLTVTDGRGGSDTVTVPITAGTPPVVTIAQPAAGTLFAGGQTLGLAGSATDAEDGPLAAGTLKWEVRFHHATHWHPYLAELVGTPQSFQTATSGETAADVWYRVYLRATDATGLVGETYVDVQPRTAVLTVQTQPAGLQVTLDGQPQPAPVVVTGVVGVTRTLGVASPQNGYTFTGWSDGGVQVHTISTPAANTTYTAFFSAPPTTTTAPPTTTTAPTTTTTAPPTSTTTPTSSTSTSTGLLVTTTTTSTNAPSTTTSTMLQGSTSTSVATSSTTSTVAPPASTTSTTGPDRGTTTTTERIVPTTTTSTLPSARCPARGTVAGVVCLIDEAQARLSVTSPEADRVVRVVSRRLRLASGQMRRVVDHCQVGRTAKARAALRDALRRIEGARTAAQARPRGAPEPTRLTAGDLSRLEALAQELRALVGKLSCP